MQLLQAYQYYVSRVSIAEEIGKGLKKSKDVFVNYST
jgi:hypothetical protein